MELGYWFFSLFVPVVLQRLLRRNDLNPKVKYPRLPKVVNEILYRFLLIENKLIQSEISFPFGTSLYGICRK